ncbi:retrovirus-related pol polyprotein from transposon TNT 1-94 [Tanacetum coccineum]
MSRTMLNEQSLPQKFWCNAVDTSTYILNRILIRAILGKTPYEILRGRKPTLDYFRVFGSKCFILNTKDYLTKYDPKSYECVFLGYSQNNKAYIILNKHTRKIEESLNVTFNGTPPPSKTSPLVDDDLDEEEAIGEIEKKNLENDVEDETLEIDEIVNINEFRNHPLENVIGNLKQRTLRSQAQNQSNFYCFISTIEPKNVNEALRDESWIVAMQEELNQFIANDVWELVPQPKNMKIIETKWVFRNKLDENGSVSRNKARLVAQGYNQQEGIDYNETYAPVARLESIRILLAHAYALDFKLFQMDVKSAFLNGFINKEVYVAQPPGFIDFEKPNHVYKLKKALYGLKQAPKAWYDRLKAFLIKHEYKMGMVDNTLFTKKKSSNLIIVQIYVDGIIFGLTCQDMCNEFSKIMHDEFEMSMMGELNLFLGLQIKQMEDGIFFNQSKYIKEMLKKFGLEDSKPMKTPMSSDTKLMKDEECESVDSTKYQGMIGTTHLGLWYPKGTDIETVVNAGSDHAGDYVDRKSTSVPYQTNPPSPDDIISFIQTDREGQVTRIRHEQEIDVQDHQILTREIVSTLKPLEEIIRENVLCMGGNRDHAPAVTLNFPTTSFSSQVLLMHIKPHQQKKPSSSHENTSASPFQSKLQLSPTPTNEPTSPQTQNLFLQNLMDVPPRPSNPQPLQSIPSLDITLSLSPITPLENPSSPPSPPSPQPPIMGHPLYYNYHDYHGSTCVCCFHNRNLHLNLRDEMNIMFAHLEYL